jgi:malonyl-CoA/methylmalonyl-CoA synthetase
MDNNKKSVQESFQYLNNDNTKVALVEGDKNHTYSELNRRTNRLATGLFNGKDDLSEERIAFLMPAGLDYVTMLFGVWRAGGIAVPLNVSSAIPELEHALTCAGVTRVIANGEYRDKLRELCTRLNIELKTVDELLPETAGDLPDISPERRAMILFTSGTTNKPKGVVSTHKNIRAQITTLIEAWAWRHEDTIPLFLPLHHIHGIINVLCCGIWAGATVSLFPKFDMERILGEVAEGRYSVFMAVPTIYVKIIQHLDALDESERKAITDGFRSMRLNISGSAACPVKVYNQWLDLTGQVLLERYGMTEIGMAISNPYEGERRAGAVGIPLPGVTVRLFDDEDKPVESEDTPGEIRIKGDNVFLEYWGNPEATRDSYRDGWFCTGDVAVLESGYYRIMGRSSVDIIKSGGYKLSALEIEGTLLTHHDIAECAVIGVADEMWGEAVAAFIVLKSGREMKYEGLKAWCEGKMSSYKIPKKIIIVDALPRNAMGKVTKPALKEMV